MCTNLYMLGWVEMRFPDTTYKKILQITYITYTNSCWYAINVGNGPRIENANVLICT
jgi:hypothetical protein